MLASIARKRTVGAATKKGGGAAGGGGDDDDEMSVASAAGSADVAPAAPVVRRRLTSSVGAGRSPLLPGLSSGMGAGGAGFGAPDDFMLGGLDGGGGSGGLSSSTAFGAAPFHGGDSGAAVAATVKAVCIAAVLALREISSVVGGCSFPSSPSAEAAAAGETAGADAATSLIRAAVDAFLSSALPACAAAVPSGSASLGVGGSGAGTADTLTRVLDVINSLGGMDAYAYHSGAAAGSFAGAYPAVQAGSNRSASAGSSFLPEPRRGGESCERREAM